MAFAQLTYRESLRDIEACLRAWKDKLYHMGIGNSEGRFRSSLLDADAYLLVCQRYIELNPVRAGTVQSPGDYPWSSYVTNVFGAPDPVVRAHPTFTALGDSDAQRQSASTSYEDTAYPSDHTSVSVREDLHEKQPNSADCAM